MSKIQKALGRLRDAHSAYYLDLLADNEAGLKGKNQLEALNTLDGEFDKIVSIGMFEHVGKKFIPAFMQKISSVLKTGGLGLLHTIGKNTPSISNPWTFKYIFPGAYIPTLHEITSEMGKTGFSIL